MYPASKHQCPMTLPEYENESNHSTGTLPMEAVHLALAPGEGTNGVWVNPAPHLATGELKDWAKAASVSSVRVPGYWVHKKGSSVDVAAPAMPGERVLYNLHGGAFIMLSARPSDITTNIPRGVLEYTNTMRRAFCLEYRPSTSAPYPAANPFPAALLDAVAGYNYLVNELGFSPANITVQGDSAGGNLAHALTRYLVEYRGSEDIKLPAPPGSLILLSPWADLGSSHDVPGASSLKLRSSDILRVDEFPGSFIDYGKRSYVGPHGAHAAEVNRYISPASLHPSMAKISFEGFPRTFIMAGGAEVLLDRIRVLKDRMVIQLGSGDGVREGEGKVKYYEAKDGVHDYLLFTWHEPERGETLKEIARWLAAV